MPSDTEAVAVLRMVDVGKVHRRPGLRRQRDRARAALHGVNLTLHAGEIVASMGQNGAGKSTLLRIAAGVETSTSGEVQRPARTAVLIELAGILHPSLTGRANAEFALRLSGMSGAGLRSALDQAAAFSELGDALDVPAREYSSGMLLRLGFSLTCAGPRPDLFVIDEVLAVGDLAFAVKCQRLLKDAATEGTAILVATQHPTVALDFADRTVVLQQGRKIADASPRDAVATYYRLLSQGRSELDPVDREPPADGALSVLTVHTTPDSEALLPPGQDIQVRLEIRAERDLPASYAFVRVRDELGATQAWVMVQPSLPPLSRGQQISLHLSFRLPLAQGRYACTVGVASDFASSHVLLDPVAWYVLAGRPSARGAVDISPTLSLA